MNKNKTYSLDEKIIEAVKKRSVNTGVPQSKIIAFAIEEYLNKTDNKERK